MKLSILFIIIFISTSVLSQDIEYAREVVSRLASPSMKGRGYVGNGAQIAADYIKTEYKKIGIQPILEDYYQPFGLSVNTFPSPLKLKLGNRLLKAGTDYHIGAGSPSITGKYKTVWYTPSDLLDEKYFRQSLQATKGKFIVLAPYQAKDFAKEEQQQILRVIDFFKQNPKNPAVGTIFLTNAKLTWSGATSTYDKPNFVVLADGVAKFDSVSVDIKNKYFEKYKTQNVVGVIKGERSDSSIVFTAHYDHLGMMGEAMFPGANDNASGVAMLLNIAKHYSKNKPTWDMVFIAFGGEELGLLGSAYFVENPPIELSRIRFLLNFDIAGTGDDGIRVVNGSIYKDYFDRLVKINKENQYLKQVITRGEACNSDHCAFYYKGVPCFYGYTLGGIQAYHDIYDRPNTLPLTEFEDYFRLIVRFVKVISESEN